MFNPLEYYFKAEVEPYLKFARPFTQHLPDSVVKVGSQLIGPLAFQRLVMDLDFFAPDSQDLMKHALSQFIGIGIISTSTIVNIPQIFSILNKKNVKGLSVISFSFEAIKYLITVLYHFSQNIPFPYFGESIFLFLQSFTILGLIVNFTHSHHSAIALILLIAIVSTSSLYFAPNSTGSIIATIFKASVIPLTILSKLPQIIMNQRNQSTGRLNAFSILNYNLGSWARLLTNWISSESHDQNTDNSSTNMAGYVIAAILNAILGLQMLLFGVEKTKTKMKKTM